MPIIWRYLLAHYLKVLFFCTFAFIALLLTLRLEEIAHFATLGPQGIYVLYFTLYQIPYILPIALPISALISSMILVKYLCKNHEMTALRAAGLSIWTLMTPLLVAASFLAVANFYIISELATNSHLSGALIKNELRSINPLLILSNKHLMKLRGIYYDTLGPSLLGESASNSIIAMPNRSTHRINLLLAKNLQSSSTDFKTQSLTLLSTSSEGDDHYDKILVENIKETTTTIKDFMQLIHRKMWTLNNDHLQLSLLLCRLHENNELLAEAKIEAKPISDIKQIQRTNSRIYSEMIRRFSIAFAVFTFTLLGATCGLSIGRTQSVKKIVLVAVLSALYISAYFSAKGIDHLLITSALFYILPHLLIIMISLWMLRNATRGVE
ncbi:MAG: LptF/LptG family permease [Parachlamydiaceae bacterium]|nr:LptF/LptG family permease [Parachlamydiaceae bacterium]